MIRFLSLWLGLVSGPLPVEMAVGPGVATIELRLDGAAIARLVEPPWTATVDLGPELLPHELEAVALAADGRMIDQVSQRLNLPRPPAEVTASLEGDPRLPSAVVLTWEAVAGVAPRSVAVWLDGRPLPPPSDLRRWPLPTEPHPEPRLLRVEVVFPGELVAHRELVFGAASSELLARDLSGIVLTTTERRFPGAAEVTLRRGEQALPLLALERGEADLVVVLDPDAAPALAALAEALGRRPVRTAGGGRVRVDPREVASLDPATRVLMLSPLAERHTAGGVARDVFRPSGERSATAGGLLWHLGTGAEEGAPASGPPRFADAVALAGLHAVERSRRRVVLLILSAAPAADESLYSPVAVRRYLSALGVPLITWTVGSTTAHLEAIWGHVEEVGSSTRFERAARELDRHLDRQRVAWVEGVHRPIDLAVEAPLHLAGVAAAPLADLERSAEEALRSASTSPRDVEAVHDDAPETTRVTDPPQRSSREDAFGDLARYPAGRFVIVSDLAPQDARLSRLRRVAERLPTAFVGRYGVGRGDDRALGELIVFADESSFRAFLAHEDPTADAAVSGHARTDRAVLPADQRSPAELLAVFLHEATHLLVHATYSQRLAPWLAEGMAEDLAMSRVDEDGRLLLGTLAGEARQRILAQDRTRGRTPILVEAVGAHGNLASLLTAYQRRLLPLLPELLALDQAAFVHPDGRRDRYSAAGFLVRFLLDAAGGRRAAALRAFLQAAADGAATDGDALAASLDEPLLRLQTLFVAWLRLESELAR